MDWGQKFMQCIAKSTFLGASEKQLYAAQFIKS